MQQGRLFTDPPHIDAARSRVARDLAVEQVEENASDDFVETAYLALLTVARTRQRFIVDAVWQAMDLVPPTNDRRVMGPVMLRGKREGIVRPSGDFMPTAQVKCHAAPRRIWISLVAPS